MQDPQVEQACKDMKDAVAEERPELTGLARDAQQAIGELNRFRREEGRTADADFPESRRLHVGILAALVIFETLINGIFFGANVTSGLFGGMSYAVLISAVNVVVLGYLAATMYRQVRHRDSRRRDRRIGGSGGRCGRRGLLEPLRGPLPRGAVARLPARARYPCRGRAGGRPGDARNRTVLDRTRRGRRRPGGALPLPGPSPFGLGGFYSYMLFLIGLAMCAFGALDWFRMDDPYPGYGRRERLRRKTEEVLSDDRRDLLARVKELHDEALRAQRAGFVDPIESPPTRAERLRQAAEAAQRPFQASRPTWKRVAAVPSTSTGRRTGRRGRLRSRTCGGQPGFPTGPGRRPPTKSDLIGEAEAEKRSREAHAALEEREKKLRTCHDECQQLVNDFTKLDPHDKAVPS